jgi:uncharacterized protein (TIGR02266 family)
MLKERRSYPRVDIPLEAEFLVAGEPVWREGTICVLGPGGVGLLSEEGLDVGTVLEELHFVIEAEEDLPETRIEVGAEVVSRDREEVFGNQSNFILGLRFTDLGQNESEFLQQFVFRRLTGSRPLSAGTATGAEDPSGLTPFEIRFKLLDEFVEEVSQSLSPSGMFIRADKPLAPGSKFAFRFQLGDDFSLFRGTAEVVWRRRRSKDADHPAGMGVRFLTLDMTSQRVAKRLLARREAAAAEVRSARLGLSENDESFGVAGESPAPTDKAPAKRSRQLKWLEKRLAKADAARKQAEHRCDRLREEVESLRDENHALESSRAEAESERVRAETEAAKLSAELESRQLDNELEEELLRLRDDLERQQEEWQGRELSLRTDLERSSAGEAESRERLAQATEVETELRQQLEEAEEGRRELERQLEERAAGEAESRERLAQAAEVETELRQQLEEAEAGRRELEQQLAERAAVEAESQERLARAAEVETELRQRLGEAEEGRQALEQQLAERAAVEKKLRDRVAKVERTRRAAHKLQRRNVEITEERDELRARVDELCAAQSDQEERLRGETDLLARIWSAARAAQADLGAKLAEFADYRSGLDERVERLSATHAGLGEYLGRIGDAWSRLEDGMAKAAERETSAPPELVVEPPHAEEEVAEDSASDLPESPELAQEPAAREEADEPDEPASETGELAATGSVGLVDSARRALARLGFAKSELTGGDEPSA